MKIYLLEASPQHLDINIAHGLYVTNYGSDSVSLVFPGNKSQIEVINDTIVEFPIAIGSDANGTIFVGNTRSDNVSVISPYNYTEIHEDIPVGHDPIDIGVDDITNTIYVLTGDLIVYLL